MAVMVDEIIQWPTSIRCFKPGSCHLTADSVDELHAFAKRLRLKREWFQNKPNGTPHYDLTIAKRERALALGAVFVSAREQAKARLAKRYRVVRDAPHGLFYVEGDLQSSSQDGGDRG